MTVYINKVEIVAVVCFGIALRAIVSLHSYSGAGKPPMYGDYEAQRHWQEITVNLNTDMWYVNSTQNDLLYWGLDYPPLTAYHSKMIGVIGKKLNTSYTELQASRGIESSSHKSFMRFTVLFADIIIYIPGVLLLSFALNNAFQCDMLLEQVILFMIYPGQILIDNGHFQYNNISLGLAAVAIAAILKKKFYLAAIFFTMALNYKQMELYHALPFFVYLLRQCFYRKSFPTGLVKLITLAIVVLSTFAIIWIPWLHSLDAILAVVERLFPFGRGVFEDKVSNFWCTLNVVYKLKSHFSNKSMAILCFTTTVAAVLPINVNLFVNARKEKFLLGLFNTAMAFFLFSFQVHEKSILLVFLPAACLFSLKMFQMYWFLEVSVFSMLPLLIKDQLAIPFFALMLIFHVTLKIIYLNNLKEHKPEQKKTEDFPTKVIKLISQACTIVIVFLALIALFLNPPASYPFLWPLLISVFSCSNFLLCFLIGVYYQLVEK